MPGPSLARQTAFRVLFFTLVPCVASMLGHDEAAYVVGDRRLETEKTQTQGEKWLFLRLRERKYMTLSEP